MLNTLFLLPSELAVDRIAIELRCEREAHPHLCRTADLPQQAKGGRNWWCQKGGIREKRR
jgi:hypothetical protein